MKRFSFRSREISLFFILIFTIGLTSFINPRFITGSGTKDLLNSTAVVAIMAVGITPIVIMKHIDLSIASTVGFSAWMIADLSKKHEGFVCGITKFSKERLGLTFPYPRKEISVLDLVGVEFFGIEFT